MGTQAAVPGMSQGNISIKIGSATKKQIERLADRMRLSQLKVLDIAVERMEREQLFEAGNAAYANLVADEEASKQFDKEFETWETAY